MKRRQKSVFKEAIKAAGMEYQSDDLWKMNIEFETKHNNLKDVAALYDRLLTIPTEQYRVNYTRCKQFMESHKPLEILNKEELDWIRSRIKAESDNYQIAAEDSDDDVESLTESDLEAYREHVLQVREQLFLLNEIEVKKRKEFEDKIVRRYFSAAPLHIKQLHNWKKYLEFEVAEGQHERIVILYERCLMACVLHEDFWLSYAKYMEGHSVEGARSIFERACRLHLQLKYSIHLQWAAFEERHGCLDSARAILCDLENGIPGLVIVRMSRVGLERRSGNLQEAERLLKEAVQMNIGTKMSGFYAVKLSRLILKLQRDQQKATAVLKEALERDPDNPMLHICMMETEMTGDNAKYAPLVCVEQALKCKLSTDSKRILSRRRLEFLEDFGTSLTSWIDAYNEHQTYLKGKEDDGKKDKKKVTTVSEELYPPGVSPPPKKIKSGVSTKNVSSNKESSTAPVSVAETITPTPIQSLIPSLVNTSGHSKTLSTPTPEPVNPYRRTALLGYCPPRSYFPPQNVQMHPVYRNQYPPPTENMYEKYNQVMPPNANQAPFNAPQAPINAPQAPFNAPQASFNAPQASFNAPQGPFNAPQFMNNSGMPFGIPPLLGYAQWIQQNFGVWNRFFPPQ